MYFLKEVLENIEGTIGKFEPESGGILALDSEGVVSDFYFDHEAGSGNTSYIPSRISIQNHVINIWASSKLKFCGVAHSHPMCNLCEPSCIDIDMALKIMTANGMEQLYLLIVKGSEMQLYCVTDQKGCEVHEEEIKIKDRIDYTVKRK